MSGTLELSAPDAPVHRSIEQLVAELQPGGRATRPSRKTVAYDKRAWLWPNLYRGAVAFFACLHWRWSSEAVIFSLFPIRICAGIAGLEEAVVQWSLVCTRRALCHLGGGLLVHHRALQLSQDRAWAPDAGLYASR